MESPEWRALLRVFPPAQQDNLLVTTKNGTEFAVHSIIRDEGEYLVIRGRMMATAESSGGFFFIPYDQIQYLGFKREVKEPVLRAMLDADQQGVAAAPPAPVPVQAAPAPAPAPAVQPAPPTPEAAAPPPAPAPPPPPPPPPKGKSGERPLGAAKAALLERLRARRAALDPNKQGGA